MKQAIFVYVNHAPIRSWNQPVLRGGMARWVARLTLDQWMPVSGQGTTGAFDGGSNSRLTGIIQLRVRRATHCAKPPQL